MRKLLTKFLGRATSGRRNYTVITNRRKLTTKLTLNGIKPQCWCGLATDILKKQTELKSKNK